MTITTFNLHYYNNAKEHQHQKKSGTYQKQTQTKEKNRNKTEQNQSKKKKILTQHVFRRLSCVVTISIAGYDPDFF